MPLHPVQDLSTFIAELRKTHPRLIVLLGETHNSIQTENLQKQILPLADVGFFEQPMEDLAEYDNHKPRATAHVSFLAQQHKKGISREELAQWELMSLPKYCAYVDEPQEKRDPAWNTKLAHDALCRDPDIDLRHFASYALVEVLDQRLVSSNRHIAKTMGDYIRKHHPEGSFRAVGILGNDHICSGPLGLRKKGADIKELLKGKDFDVVTIECKIAQRLGSRQNEGDYQLYQSLDNQSTDYWISVIDSPVYAQMHSFRLR